MRLLEASERGYYDITKKIFDENVPLYAILSHTWGADDDEIKLYDLPIGPSATKVGYEKIRFCGEQAQRDGLRYFWIDTCCIDKTDSVELQETVTSMYRWYKNAVKCYVYLSDVSCLRNGDDLQAWESEFRSSRWFRRGWTLQELLAPAHVEFFSQEGIKLGDKLSSEHYISDITKIPFRALRDTTAHEYSVEELLEWQERRQTRRKEDKAYSLLGICGVHMTLRYGEGEASAFRRLQKKFQDRTRVNSAEFQSEEDLKCLKGLFVTDPSKDKTRIQQSKGGLLTDVYEWKYHAQTDLALASPFGYDD